ncbi:F-box/kelch-repeat protein At1g23390 [Euphorbia lathyris]|uniref:F-box/kelch-repeat protein At1g23390 n=1 Tax=Euphorbia lathyris TaxID=212925 RepID=UPI003313D37C
MKNSQFGQKEAAIHGDVLESIFTHVPLIDLVPAVHVSTSWKRAVLTSLRHFNKLKPWLFLHSQSTRSPYSVSLHAFDPRSQIWIRIILHRPIQYISAIRSSHSNLVYMLSPSKFSFSFDPMYLTWYQINAPLRWRTDPIVAAVGRRIIVAGGTCDFEDDPLSVEIYDLETRCWETADSMPSVFKDSASSMWLSVTVNGNRMYVMEKTTGVAHWFDPETKSWFGPFNFRPDVNICSSSIGFANDRLILIGLIGDDEEVLRNLKLWEISGESLEFFTEIGDMPEKLVEKLRGEEFYMSSAVVNVMGNLLYVSSSSNPGNVFLCEIRDGACSWSSVENVVVNEKFRLTERMVFSCGNVGLGDLHKAMATDGREFVAVGKY